MHETIWQRRDCVSAQVEDSLVLLDLDTLVYHSLNSTAAAVWSLLETAQDEHALTNALCTQYEVEPDHCLQSVHHLIAQLAEKKLVAPMATVS